MTSAELCRRAWCPGTHREGGLVTLRPHSDRRKVAGYNYLLLLRFYLNAFSFTFFSLVSPLRTIKEMSSLTVQRQDVDVVWSSIGATLAFLTSLPVQDGGPHDTKMAAPMTSGPRLRPPRHQDGGPTKSDTRWRPL